MTQFEQAVQAAKEGKIETPNVTYGGQQVDYFWYQLQTAKHSLKVLSIGLKMKGVKFSQIKEYYGLSARSAKDAVAEFESVIEAYKANR